jgi:hypothetical protein
MYRIENRRTGCADKPCIGEYFTSQSMDEIISGALDILARIGIRIHTWAKRAGVQAAVEKSTLMMAGALNGASYFDGLGTLSLDEVFSPVQLVLDIEIMNHVSRVVAGMSVDAMPSDLCGMIAEGLDRGNIGSISPLIIMIAIYGIRTCLIGATCSHGCPGEKAMRLIEPGKLYWAFWPNPPNLL